MKWYRHLATVSVCFVSLVATILPSIAHHGFTGRYDRAPPIYVSGTVRNAKGLT